MSIRLTALGVALFAALVASKATASSARPDVTPGEVQLVLSSDTVSTFPIDVQEWAETTCDPTGLQLRNQPVCHLTTPESKPVLRLAIQPGGPGQPVQWQIIGLNLSLAPVETSCGIWDVSLTLDPTNPQPATPVILTPASDDPGHGIFAGVLEMSTNLLLSNRDTGQIAAANLRLGLNLGGPWTLSSPESAAGSNLLLFADHGGDGGSSELYHCNSMVVLTFDDALGKFVACDCSLCVQAPEPLRTDITGNP